jgi:hypothetical protein
MIPGRGEHRDPERGGVDQHVVEDLPGLLRPGILGRAPADRHD